MPNHSHMLVQTPEANIWISMRHLNGVYTQRYNSRHKCDGPLFRGRYKSILIDTDSYLLQDKKQILDEVCKVYDTTAEEVIKMRRGKMNEARNVAIYMTRVLRGDTLREIGQQFDIDNDSTVSSVMERVKKRLDKDQKFYRRLDGISKLIQKS
jgi:chromosomal replication initiation ATPase DnaA